MMSGRLVAPIMNTFFLLLIPSISVRIWLITRSAAPPGRGEGREREGWRKGGGGWWVREEEGGEGRERKGRGREREEGGEERDKRRGGQRGMSREIERTSKQATLRGKLYLCVQFVT